MVFRPHILMAPYSFLMRILVVIQNKILMKKIKNGNMVSHPKTVELDSTKLLAEKNKYQTIKSLVEEKFEQLVAHTPSFCWQVSYLIDRDKIVASCFLNFCESKGVELGAYVYRYCQKHIKHCKYLFCKKSCVEVSVDDKSYSNVLYDLPTYQSDFNNYDNVINEIDSNLNQKEKSLFSQFITTSLNTIDPQSFEKEIAKKNRVKYSTLRKQKSRLIKKIKTINHLN